MPPSQIQQVLQQVQANDDERDRAKEERADVDRVCAWALGRGVMICSGQECGAAQ